MGARRLSLVLITVLAAGSTSIASWAQFIANDDGRSGQPPTPASPVPPGVPAGNGSPSVAAISEQAMRYLVPPLGADAPGWLKRTEVTGGLRNDGKPEYSILTVQPLIQSEDKRDTLFIQGSQLRYSMYGQYRDTTNIGFGYRRLLLNNTLLLGANSFFDREWTYSQQRIGFGADAMWQMLDFHVNGYRGLTGDHSVGLAMSERVMNGWDTELRSQVPFIPWARVGLQRYSWSGELSRVEGWAYSLDMDVTPNVSMELGSRTAALPGTNSDGASARANLFLKVTLHFADTSRPVAASSDFISDRPFTVAQDLSSHTLDKVRRENRIITERTIRTNGVTVVVGRSG